MTIDINAARERAEVARVVVTGGALPTHSDIRSTIWSLVGDVLALAEEVERLTPAPTCKACGGPGSTESHGHPGGRADQLAPVPNGGPAIWGLLIAETSEQWGGASVIEEVLADMRERDRIGAARYGVRLQARNGRDFLRDAYEEALDLAVYLRGGVEEKVSTDGEVADTLAIVFKLRARLATRRVKP